MSDAPNVASEAGGEAPVVPVVDLEKKLPPADTGGAALEELAGGDEAQAPAPPNWPDNWKEMLAKNDPATQEFLRRYASPEGLLKKAITNDKYIKSTRVIPDLPEDATDEERAAHRKALGIPEKPEDYGLKFADEVKPTEADTALLKDFMADMHGKNMTPATVKGMFDWYQGRMVAQREAHAEALRDAKVEAQMVLRQEYGRELRRELGALDRFLEDEGLQWVLETVLPNGKPVSRDADALKKLINFRRDVAPDTATIGGDSAGGGQSSEERAKELRAKSIAGKITPAEDAELNRYYERRTASEERQGRRQATSAAAA